MLQLLDLPPDILLHLVQYLEVEDALSFLKLSSDLRNLFQVYERVCLIKTLSLTRQSRPIPCAPSEDIAQYDVKTLQRLVQHFTRLNHNWRSDKPQPIQPIRTLTVDKRLDTVAHIPGTNYVITHSFLKSRLSVWSTLNGKRVCTIPCHQRMLDLSTGWSERGKFTIALLTNLGGDTNPTGIQVLTVDYSGPKVTINISWSRQLQQVEARCFRAIFMNAEVVGVLYMHYSRTSDLPSPLHVLAFNRLTGKETDICVCPSLSPDEHRRIWQIGQVGTSFWNDNLYIHSESDIISYQQWVPRELLPYGDNLHIAAHMVFTPEHIPFVQHPPQMRYETSASHVQLEGILTTQSDFGVMASTIYCISDDASPVTLINFWVIDKASLTMAQKSNRLPIPTLYPCVVIPGTIRGSDMSAWYLCQSTNCGTYLILLSDNQEMQGIKLHMVNFQIPERRFTVHAIDLPPFIRLHLISGFFVDEYRGTVTLYQAKGRMFVLHFA
ncbi:hypothetical protein APHAL10511_004755 [Amanita phalloides]|nr:hypothetical protein APHAL10511_004755 [Amanita phalloides]